MDKQFQDKISDVNINIAVLAKQFTRIQLGEDVDFKSVNGQILEIFTDIAELLEEITEAL